MRRIFFVAVHPPGRVPSQRFRFEQYVGVLRAHGFETTFAPLLRERDYARFYRSGGYMAKAAMAGRGVMRRLRDIYRASRYDIVFVQREATYLGTALFESAFARSRAKLVFDFDDAIWLPDVSAANRRLAWIKRPEKTRAIIALADIVFAGNGYLASYAREHNDNVVIIPTTIDTAHYVRGERTHGGPVRIGWTGSVTSLRHFDLLIPALRTIKRRYGSRVTFSVIGDERFRNDELGILGMPWRPTTEVEDIARFDIGVMPMPSDEWSEGKCGLKALQCMALEIPTVVSPIGVNREIIEHGSNGFWASTTADWVSALSALIDSPELRRTLGVRGRQTVIESYSVESQKSRYLECLQTLVS